jgi:NADH-quinone oxidoreductase subunit L
MLMLVMGSSLPIVFLGWEGVGLCSYLLIGYWYSDLMKAKAGKKAFIVNRVGDMGFLIGIFLTFHTFGTLDFEALRTAVSLGGHDSTLITAICLLLFVGCAGKSAQIPLYVWLPDAMAGPTPVSALIHAATMVTSGIYLLARLNFLYNLAPVALHFVATVGVATAFFAATIAVAQKDIKKVLAYSTVSQLGYMFLACGVGAYSAAVFHVITHAFFKALLFLGAGSVIHGVHEEQNIWKMGGLREKMPKTFFTFLIGWLAISGIPPFSGFFSKDEILWQAYSSASGSVGLWLVGLITAAMTAFYMTRLFVLTFLGEPRMGEVAKRSDHHQADSHPAKHPSVHESPATMVVPLQILAGMSLVVGLIGIPHRSWLEKWLEPVISSHLGAHLEVAEIGRSVAPQMEWILMGVSTVVAVLSIRFGWLAYRNLDLIQVWTKRFQSLHGILENKWYVDEIYERMIVRPIYVLSEFLWKGLDIGLIDRIVLSFGQASEWTGERLRVVQSGSIQVYALVFLFGLVVTAGYLVYVWI